MGSNSPAPGGGSVSALCGSLGAGLASMVAVLTHEKKEFIDDKPKMNILGEEAQKLKDRLLWLVDEDTKAFNNIMASNRLPQSNPQEKRVKTKAVLKSNMYAIQIPWEVAELSFQMMKLAFQLVKEGNPNSVSDAGVAGEVGMAAIRGACLNVLINLSGVEQNKKYVKEMNENVQSILANGEKLQKQIFKETVRIIKT